MRRNWTLLLFMLSIATGTLCSSRTRNEVVRERFLDDIRRQEQQARDAFIRQSGTTLDHMAHSRPSFPALRSTRMKRTTTGTEYGPDTAYVQTDVGRDIIIFHQRSDTAVSVHYYNVENELSGSVRDVHRQHQDPEHGISFDEYTEQQWSNGEWVDQWRWTNHQQSKGTSNTSRCVWSDRSDGSWMERDRYTHCWYYRPLTDTTVGYWISCDSSNWAYPFISIDSTFGRSVTTTDGSSFLRADSQHSATGTLTSSIYFDPDSPTAMLAHAETQTTRRYLYTYAPSLHQYRTIVLVIRDDTWVPEWDMEEEWYDDHSTSIEYRYSDTGDSTGRHYTYSYDDQRGIYESYIDTLNGKEWIPNTHVRQLMMVGSGDEWYVNHEEGWRYSEGEWMNDYRMQEEETDGHGHLRYHVQQWNGSSWSDSGRYWYLPPVHGLFICASMIDFHPAQAGGILRSDMPLPVRSPVLSITNYPNPFNPRTNLHLTFPVRGEADARVYDLTGREVAVVMHGTAEPGTTEAAFDGSRLPSGTYFLRLTMEGRSMVHRMLLLK